MVMPSLVADRQFLCRKQVQALLDSHPNSSDGQIVPDVHWPLLVQFYCSGESNEPIPEELAEIIDQIRSLQLPRVPIHMEGILKLPSEIGMSIKKVHEVARMVTYVVRLIEVNNLPLDRLRIVDVGAGQGYLTRALKYYVPPAQILALDANEGQTIAAQKWEHRLLPNATPPIAHRSILVTPKNLINIVDEWVHQTHDDSVLKQSDSPLPVLFMALHACGSLTVNILRSFIGCHISKGATWSAVGVVAVGCCYNLMYPNDFPLSHAYTMPSGPILRLPTSAFHLAAQVPSEWLRSLRPPEPVPSVSLATRKIVYRALLDKILSKAALWTSSAHHNSVSLSPALKPNKSATVPVQWTYRPESWLQRSTYEIFPATSVSGYPPSNDVASKTNPSQSYTKNPIRLGRMNDRCYASWSSFLRAVEQKISVKFSEMAFHEERKGLEDDNANFTLEKKLEVLHTMRCLLGPAIESAILRDRVQWLTESLASGTEVHEKAEIKLVNLFNQATGSGRNVAIVIAPKIPFVSDV